MRAPVTRLLADMLSSTTYADLSRDAIAETERAILDWLGSALAGSIEPPARSVQGVVATFGAADEATVLGAGRSSAAGAALANGVASHMLELDDVHKQSTLHGAAPVIPAALAVAERECADGPSFVLAVALGYEAALRIGESVNPSHYRFWHPTGTAGTFGAAAAAGSLMRLNASEMLDALGSAGTQAAGLWEFNADGAMSKHLHPGKAAFNGVLSADLARAGFTGATRILEGERGFFEAMSTSHDAARVTNGLGHTWKITENCYKLHACCGHTHSAIDVVLDLRLKRGWSRETALAQIAAIELNTYGPGFRIVSERNPRTPAQAKFSLAYCVAVGLLEGMVGLDQFAPGRFCDDGVCDANAAALLDRMQITVQDALTAKYPAAWPAIVRLRLNDGSVLSGSTDYPRGNPENPVSTAVLEEKFVSLVEPRWGVVVTRRALEMVREIGSCKNVSRAFSRLGPD